MHTQVRNGNDVLEIVFEYYELLLKQLTAAVQQQHDNEDEQNVIHFSNFYYGMRISLQSQVETSKDYNKLISNAKQQLFHAYYQELLEFHRRMRNEEMALQLEHLFHPYQAIMDNRVESNFSDDTRMESIPISSIYKKVDKDKYTSLLSKNENGSGSKKPIHTKIYSVLSTLLPWLVWIPEYRHHITDLKDDIIAGLTVGALVIPQSMAYSTIAGMPPVYGLYTSLLPIFIYAIFGTSRQLAVGPTAVSALLLSSSMHQLSANLEYGTPLYISYALLFAILGGCIQLLLGIFRLGFLVNFLSNPVLSGFTSAAALIIAASQLNNLLGIHLPKDNRIQFTLINVIKAIGEIHFPTLAMGLTALFFLYFIDHVYFKMRSDISFTIFKRKFTIPQKIKLKWMPSSFLLVVLGIIAVVIIKAIGQYDTSNHDLYGIAIVGKVPANLPVPGIPKIPEFNFAVFQEVFLLCLSVVVVSFMESISTAKHYAAQRGYEIDTNQELIALGAANLVGGFFKAFPCTGSLCRTSVSANAGAKTPLAGVITGFIVLLTLLILTPLFYYLPMPVLAAVIIHSTTKIPDYDQVTFTYTTKKRDFILLVVAFIGTLFIGILEGILIAAAASLVLVVLRSSRPPFSKMGRLPGSTAYQELEKSSICKEIPGVLVARFDADLYFANVQYFKDCVKQYIKQAEYEVFVLVLDCSSISYVDSTAVAAFRDLMELLEDLNVELFIAQMKQNIKKPIKKGTRYRKDQFFIQLHDAVLHAESVVTTKLRSIEIQRKADQNGEISSYDTTDIV